MVDCFNKNIDNLKLKKLWLFDMDGTIYLENSLFKKVKNLLNFITENGGNYVFITNNSSKSVADYVEKLTAMGLSVNEENFFTSSQAAALFLNKNHAGELVYAQGTTSFINELNKNNVLVTTNYDENAKVILVSFDTELTSEKIRTTCKMLTKVSATYYATNPDWVCPVDFGYIPDCGSMCEGYFLATGKRPEFIGKPSPFMVDEVVKKYGVNKNDAVVLGDRLYTDIASGVNAGVDTVFVLSGEGTLKTLNESEVKPTYVLNGVWEILE
ncbi:MAG: HAD-IIA family hydrolase [Clostridia bacterium]|nr:HAD-IIA family hydrolase [Clostridia bacterium]